MHYYHMFWPTVAIIRYIEFFTFTLYSCLLHLPTLASTYTLGVFCLRAIKCTKY
jgi:hypothetical protein